MSPEQWQQVGEVFGGALALEAGRRDEYVARACGADCALREEVEKLLAADAQAADFLDPPTRPVPALPTTNGAVSRGVPGYEILGELGRGGMGVVYKARQVNVNRVVALKMILSGAHAGAQELARFRREAEAVARLDHPHIVHLYDYGDVDGQPYFSMEFVGGGNLAQQMSAGPWSARAAAELLECLARAMHSAHERGIVHRDLKPANILLVSGGVVSGEWINTGLPLTTHYAPLTASQAKIADFGLAKELGADQTQSRTIVGTPSYMAPEQALGQARNIGPATDVYSLGAILYELLTGRPPFRADSPAATLRDIAFEEPVSVVRLQRNVPRDLGTICMKCLQKEPARRYASAAALADDLRRFLAGKPIQARPVGRLERLWRWARRNPLPAGLAAALLLVLVGALASVTRQWQRAEANYRESDASLSQARAVIHRLLVASEDDLRAKSGVQSTRKKLLSDVLKYYEQLRPQRPDDPDLQFDAAYAYHVWGNYIGESGNIDEARAALGRAADLLIEVGDRCQRPTNCRNVLAATYFYVGALERKVGRLDAALASHQRAETLWRALADTPSARRQNFQRNLALAYWAIGGVYVDLGKLDTAYGYYEKARAIREPLLHDYGDENDARQLLADNQQRVGWLHHLAGRPDDAIAALTRARSNQEQLVAANRGHIWWQCYLAKTNLYLAIVQHARGQHQPARAALAQAQAALEPLVRDNPEVNEFAMVLAEVRLNLGKLHQEAEENAAAADDFAQAAALCGQLLVTNPAVTHTRAILADSGAGISRLARAQGREEAARTAMAVSLTIWQQLATEHPDIPRFQAALAAVKAPPAGQ